EGCRGTRGAARVVGGNGPHRAKITQRPRRPEVATDSGGHRSNIRPDPVSRVAAATQSALPRPPLTCARTPSGRHRVHHPPRRNVYTAQTGRGWEGPA